MASALCTAEDCNRLVFEAVNESSVSKFQLVKHAYSQIEVLTSLVQWNEEGETPLLIAMKMENYYLINELVHFLHYYCYWEVAKRPVMSEESDAIGKLLYHQIPIMELIEHLINNQSMYNNWFDFVAQVAFKSTSLSRQEKIIALELIGGSLGICDTYFGMQYFEVMFRCWREAMTLRYSPADGEPLLPKIPYVGFPSVESSVVFGSAAEVMSMEELNLFEEHLKNSGANPDEALMCKCEVFRQCLLVIRRICSQATHVHLYPCYLQNLYEFGMGTLRISKFSDDVMNIKIAINTFLLFLEQVTELDPQLRSLNLFYMFIKALREMSFYLAFMTSDQHGYPGREEFISYTNLLALTKFVGTIPKFFPNPAMLMSVIRRDYLADLISDLIFILEYISPRLNKQERKQLEDYFRNYIRNLFPERTSTVLHAGVRALLCGKFSLSTFSDYLKPIQLMIKLGADPNAIDEKGRTPLHILAGKAKTYLDENLPIFQALVAAGAHLDMGADNGDTVLDILKRNLVMYKNRGVAAEAYFSSLINKVFRLSCYCARVIRQNRIQFDEDRLPLHLQDFVSRHSDKGSSTDMIDLNLALLFGSSNIL